MKITLMQTDITWCDPIDNIRRNGIRLAGLEETDIVVLPEMFSTGFTSSPETDSEKEGVTLEWMKKTAAERGFAICGSISVGVVSDKSDRSGQPDRYFNRFYFVTPDGDVHYYDKVNLFSFAGESRAYTPGQDRVVVEYKGMKILLLTCFDLRFPEISRNSICADGKPEYDIAIYVASWPNTRKVAWSTLLRARAIENQCYVIGVNRVGKDADAEYSGDSAAYDPIGRSVGECGLDTDTMITVEANPIFLRILREEFPILRDSVSFSR